MRQQSSLARLLASAALTAILAAGLALPDHVGYHGIGESKAEAKPDADPHRAVEVYGERYAPIPKMPRLPWPMAKALRTTGQRSQAVAMLEQATITHPATRRCSPATAGRLRQW